MRDAAGNLYGATGYGGAHGGGTIFELLAGSGYSFSLLYSLSGGNDGGSRGRLTLAPDGSLYGATLIDGLYSKGGTFKLTNHNGTWSYISLHDFTGGDDGYNPSADRHVSRNRRKPGSAARETRRVIMVSPSLRDL